MNKLFNAKTKYCIELILDYATKIIQINEKYPALFLQFDIICREFYNMLFFATNAESFNSTNSELFTNEIKLQEALVLLLGMNFSLFNAIHNANNMPLEENLNSFADSPELNSLDSDDKLNLLIACEQFIKIMRITIEQFNYAYNFSLSACEEIELKTYGTVKGENTFVNPHKFITWARNKGFIIPEIFLPLLEQEASEECSKHSEESTCMKNIERNIPENPLPLQKKPKRTQKRGAFTQEQASKVAGVSLRTIQNWEAGKNTPEEYPTRKDAMVYTLWANKYKTKKEVISNIADSGMGETKYSTSGGGRRVNTSYNRDEDD